MRFDPAPFLAVARGTPRARHLGRVTRAAGLLIEARGAAAPVGELCLIERRDRAPLPAEIVGFREGATLLMPLGDADGLLPGAVVRPEERKLSVGVGEALLGRVLDGLGRPADGLPPPEVVEERPLLADAPRPMDRLSIDAPLETGVSVIDGFLTLGRGQRVGIFAGSGVGKSTLLGELAKRATADVNVIALIGERGREVGQFIEEILGPEGLRKSVVIAATSDAPALVRIKSAYVATAIAEWFRDRGKDVLLTIDSVTRFASATREVGLALGEPPTTKGYPPSFFSAAPRLVERAGRTRRGSITGLCTVLVDGDDLNDPVADTMRGLLDGHFVLSRELARRRHPAVDVLGSVSRLMDRVATPEHRDAAAKARRLLATYEDAKDLLAVGAYKPGADPQVDKAVRSMPEAEALLAQKIGEARPMAETVRRLRELAARAE
ncbi:MAG TPA: FliI/YscN family ATPase [Planctomycetota bacterium]|nr:FliI/YscN family ATPase [Planctomycetota bacterium]